MHRCLQRAAVAAAVATLTLALPAQAGGPEYTIEAVALEGDALPGAGGGVLDGISSLAGGRGRAFVVGVRIAGGSATRGLYRVADGALTPLRFAGDPTPVGGVYSIFLGYPSIASNDVVVFAPTITGGGVTEAIVLYGAGGDTLLVAVGDPAPDSGGGTFSHFRSQSVNAAGDVVFHAEVSGGSVAEGVYLYASGAVTRVADESDLSPGGLAYGWFGPPHLGDGGEIVFAAGHGVAGDTVLVRVEGATAVAVASDGAVAPDTGGDVYRSGWLGGFTGVSLAGDGRIGFAAVLESCVEEFIHPYLGPVAAPFYCAVFEWDAGALRLVARNGDPAPVEGGGTYQALTSPWLGGAGSAVFANEGAYVAGNHPPGLYVQRDGVDEVLARAGHDLAGIPGALDPYPVDPLMNAQGAVVFSALYGLPIREEGLFLARLGAPVPALPGPGVALLGLLLAASGVRVLARRSRTRSATPGKP